jgi:CubicO group peptidase (beta-lactamase class C family)
LRALVLVALASGCSSEAMRARIVADAVMGNTIADGRARGCSVAIEQHGRRLVARGYGHADAAGRRAEATTVYRIGSITKQFTAAAVLQLAAAGKLRLDADAAGIAPGVLPADAHPTVAQLLSHTAGIEDFMQDGLDLFAERSRTQMLALFAGRPLRFAPGRRWEYSNSGYILAGVLIEDRSGESYGDYVERHLVVPLGLRDTFYWPTHRDDARLALPYDRDGSRIPPFGGESPDSDGGMCSTVLDLVDWWRALSSGRVVAAADFQRMITRAPLHDGSRAHYGLGVGIYDRDGVVYAHSGCYAGYSGALAHYVDDDLTIATLCNARCPIGANLEEVIGEDFRHANGGRIAFLFVVGQWRVLAAAVAVALLLLAAAIARKRLRFRA